MSENELFLKIKNTFSYQVSYLSNISDKLNDILNILEYLFKEIDNYKDEFSDTEKNFLDIIYKNIENFLDISSNKLNELILFIILLFFIYFWNYLINKYKDDIFSDDEINQNLFNDLIKIVESIIYLWHIELNNIFESKKINQIDKSWNISITVFTYNKENNNHFDSFLL